MKNKKPKGMTLVQYVAEHGLHRDITSESERQMGRGSIARKVAGAKSSHIGA